MKIVEFTYKTLKKFLKTAFSSKSAKKCKNPLTKGDIHDIIIKLSDESEEKRGKQRDKRTSGEERILRIFQKST